MSIVSFQTRTATEMAVGRLPVTEETSSISKEWNVGKRCEVFVNFFEEDKHTEIVKVALHLHCLAPTTLEREGFGLLNYIKTFITCMYEEIEGGNTQCCNG